MNQQDEKEMQANTFDELNPPPWYRQFWPWFLITPPLGTIIAAMITINIAIETDDGLVSENYYKDGLAIHRDADALARARALGVVAQLQFDTNANVVQVNINSNSLQAFGQLQLALDHPTLPNQDHLLSLQPVSPTTYEAKLPELVSGNWKVKVIAEEAGWRLSGRASMATPNVTLR